jgi:hypothetical protein
MAADKLTVTSIRPDVNTIRTRGTFELVAEALDRLDGNMQRTAGFVNAIDTGTTVIEAPPVEPPPEGAIMIRVAYESL